MYKQIKRTTLPFRKVKKLYSKDLLIQNLTFKKHESRNYKQKNNIGIAVDWCWQGIFIFYRGVASMDLNIVVYLMLSCGFIQL